MCLKESLAAAIRDWKGTRLDDESRTAALSAFSSEAIDQEFVPYIARVNSLPFVITRQSCVGHLAYGDNVPPEYLPPEFSDKWGYLQLMLTEDATDWICECAADWCWLWRAGSELFLDGASMPQVTECGYYFITFAWDSKEWPQPAEDITNTLEDLCLRG